MLHFVCVNLSVCKCGALQAHAKAMSEAEKLLQMTPVVAERAWRGETLKYDQKLEGFLDHRMVFTDISMNRENRVRNVLVLLSGSKPLLR